MKGFPIPIINLKDNRRNSGGESESCEIAD